MLRLLRLLYSDRHAANVRQVASFHRAGYGRVNQLGNLSLRVYSHKPNRASDEISERYHYYKLRIILTQTIIPHPKLA